MRRALALLALVPAAAAARPVEVADWGRAADGAAAHLYTLTNANGMRVRVSDWGALIVAVEVPDRAGHVANVANGFATLAEYEARNRNYAFGSPIGRYANRIAGAAFTIDGKPVRLTPNDGPNALHGGPGPGYQARPWTARTFDHGGESGVVLHLVSPAGDQGFPGTLDLTLTYTLTADNALRLDYRATTDAPTALNLTNHCYFNLSGAGHGTVLGETIQVFADRVAELGERKIPTGRLLPVTGSLDLRRPRVIGDAIAADPKLAADHGYDTPFVLADAPRAAPAPAVRVSDPASGRVMEMLTTEPSVQVYTGNGMGAPDHAPDGGLYVKNGGLALEAQHLIDSVHHPEWPTTILRPGEIYRQTTIYRFSVTR